ncbi:MAG: DUF3726 domain-containing protein [Hyphomicrobiales bacterium]
MFSLNEISATLRKAAVGSGFDVGRAQDIAAAGCWLISSGYDGAGAVLKAIEAGPQPISFDGENSHFQNVHVASCGLAAVDIVEGSERFVVSYNPLDVPELLLGFVGVASAANDNDYTIAFGSKGGVLLCVEPDTSLDDFFGDKAAKMTLWTVRQGVVISKDDQISQEDEHRMDLETWVKLLDLAQKTYVPASEASRLSGAGAGLVDND